MEVFRNAGEKIAEWIENDLIQSEYFWITIIVVCAVNVVATLEAPACDGKQKNRQSCFDFIAKSFPNTMCKTSTSSMVSLILNALLAAFGMFMVYQISEGVSDDTTIYQGTILSIVIFTILAFISFMGVGIIGSLPKSDKSCGEGEKDDGMGGSVFKNNNFIATTIKYLNVAILTVSIVRVLGIIGGVSVSYDEE